MTTELDEVLDSIEEFLESLADAEYFPDRAGPVGNKEMGLLSDLRSAREAYKAAQPVQPSLTTNSAQISSGLVVEDGKVIEGAKENSRDS